jgi:hypothetical protein
MARPILLSLSALLPLLLVGGLVSPAAAQTSAIEEVSLLREIVSRTETAHDASRAAETAATVDEVKAAADSVFEAVWGVPSGLADDDAHGASAQHGWKTRWQTSPAAFDSAFAARLGTEEPEITDPRKLGIVGRALHLRGHFAVAPDSAGPETPGARYSHEAVVAPLSNVIGWMRMDNGITKGELQPRVDLTYKWDAPVSFWQSTADTGWLYEAYAQALNILKTNYDGDVDVAREHAEGMTQLLEKTLNGVDANGNGTVEPIMQEGGLRIALREAEAADDLP